MLRIPHHHHHHQYHRRLLWMLASFWLSLSMQATCTADAYKHNYFTKDDDRAVIGPLGFPFGFTKTGHYNLTVYDYELKFGVHDMETPGFVHGGNHGDHGNHGRRPLETNSIIDTENSVVHDYVDGVGFLLKRFDDEATFNHFMAYLEANDTRCALQPFLNSIDTEGGNGNGNGNGNGEDDVLTQDDDEFKFSGDGYGEMMMDPGTDGIFLNMLPKSRWGPATPLVFYDFKAGEEGLYFLIYQICFKQSVKERPHLHSKFELDFKFSNLDSFGNESYLPAGEMFLPHMFFYFSLLYMICVYLWLSNIRMINNGGYGHFAEPVSGGGRPIVYPIHYLMGGLLVLKTAAIFFESIRFHYLRVSGKTILWSAVYYTFAFMKGTILFTVILLIGSGWSFVKPFLSDREKQMACAILGLQTINNLAIVVLSQRAEGEKSFARWTAILHMVDILCCCAVLIPIVWQVNALERNIEQSNGDHNDNDDDQQQVLGDIYDDADDERIREEEFDDDESNKPRNGRLAAKLKLFRSFYLLVVSYIYVTRIVVYLFATMLDYRHEWLRFFVVEAVTLAFYCKVGMQFRPMSENPYLTVSTKSGGEDEHVVELTSQSTGVF